MASSKEFLEIIEQAEDCPKGMAMSIKTYGKMLLDEYNRFLLKNGYTDTDIVSEEPTAIDQFLKKHG